MSNNLDLSKIGFHWRGNYNSMMSYNENDVVRKNGDVYVYQSGSLQPFALGQNELGVNQILLKSSGAGGLPGQQLIQQADGTVRFDFPQARSGIRAVSLSGMNDHCNDSNYNSDHCWHAIMSDGSIKGCGSNREGQLGVGSEEQDYVRPVTVPFPKSAPKFIKVISAWQATFFLGDNGEVWSCGKSTHNGHDAEANIPKNLSQNSELQNEFVIEIVTDHSNHSTSAIPQIFARTITGKVFAWGGNDNGSLGLGDTNARPTPTLVPFTENTPIRKVVVLGSKQDASFFIDTNDNLYVSGDRSTSLFSADDLLEHRLFMPWGSKKVKSVQVTSGAYRSGATWVRGRESVVVLVEGTNGIEAYGRGFISSNNLPNPYTMTFYRSLTNSPLWEKGVTSVVPFGTTTPVLSTTAAKICYAVSQKSQQIICVDDEGYLYHLGYSNYFHVDSTDTGSSHANWYQLDTSIAYDIERVFISGGENAVTILALRADGVLVSAGYNGPESCRMDGKTSSMGVSILPLPFEDRVVDVFVGGEFVEDNTNKNERQVLILNESGEVFAAGKNTSGTLARGTITYSSTFQKIHF